MDGIASLFLLSMLVAVLAKTVNDRCRAVARLADTRDASRFAEAALLDLQQGRSVERGVAVRSLDDGWVQVSASVNGRTVTLTGFTRRQP
jgi:hypothetical protein